MGAPVSCLLPSALKRSAAPHRTGSLWHPGSQMKHFEDDPPLSVTHAAGVFMMSAQGVPVLDAISSWWCKALGHGHPLLKAALLAQCDTVEHVMAASTTHATLETLSHRLTHLRPPLSKVFYAGDGSCAVEIALKMSLHSRRNTGDTHRTGFMSLRHGYHGETCGALSVSDLGRYKDPYAAMLFACDGVDVPYVSGTRDPLWSESKDAFDRVLPQLEAQHSTLTALIVEPILQAAGHMRVYSQDFLTRLHQWCLYRGVHLIADEIMTGFGRTGPLFACDHSGIVPDFMCLSKGLTSGWMPFSAVLTTDAIYEAFYGEDSKTFYHSHTYSGHALGAAVALETLTIIEDLVATSEFSERCHLLQNTFKVMAQDSGVCDTPRGLGMVVAAEINAALATPDTLRALTRCAMAKGVLLRPLGNTLYWTPPLIITNAEIHHLATVTADALHATFLS